jgi:hypothetical protein
LVDYISSNLSLDEAKDLLENRVKFKLYSAKNHLNNLRSFKQTDNVKIRTSEGRVTWEIEIECFLFHIIGVKDSLLVQINDKLGLGINAKEVDLGKVNSELNARGKGALIADLNKAVSPITSNTPAGWLWMLNELRNQSTHRSLINVQFKVEVGSSDEPKVYFVIDPEQKLEVIPFLEQSLKDMKDLVENIKNVEPLLR